MSTTNPTDLIERMARAATDAGAYYFGSQWWVDLSEEEKEYRIKEMTAALDVVRKSDEQTKVEDE